MLINQVLFKFIMDWLMTQRDILKITFTASNLIPLSMLTTLWKLKIWLVWKTVSTISKKASISHMSENHLDQVSVEITIGRNKQTVVKLSLVFHLKEFTMLKNWFMFLLAEKKKIHKFSKCTEKLMVISLPENKRKEITTGDSNQQIKFSAIVKRKFWMVPLWHFKWRGMLSNSHRQWLLRRQ